MPNRKVLLVSYHAPPRDVVAAHRIGGLIDNLPSFGWSPIVCSGPPLSSPLYKVLHLNSEQNLMAQLAQLKAKLHMFSEKSALDRLASLYAEVMCFPDPMKKWASSTQAQKYFDQYRPDVVMSHSFPHTSHVLASRIRRDGVPWVASFSDLWTESHFYPYSRFRKRREKQLEEETLRGCRCFVTVSPQLSRTLEDMHYRPAFTVMNGYPQFPDAPLTQGFTMTYTGNFYPERYDIQSFCRTIALYRYRFPELRVRVYGQPYPAFARMVAQYRIDNIVQFSGNVSHADALKAQKQSHILLHFAWNDKRYQGVYSAKMMEYLGAKRPIISFGGNDEKVGQLLQDTGAGVWARTSEEFAYVVAGMYKEYKTYGAPVCRSNGNVADYSMVKMAERHAEIFERLVSR